MILDRQYQPAGDELVYHYCRSDTFVQIVTSRTMWHTAYYVLNDLMEREWGYSIFEKAIEKFRQEIEQTKSENSEQFFGRVVAAVKASYAYSVVMISCYSLDADVLSQWRAYGENGAGFAVGFSPKLVEMPAKQLRVLYEEEAQIQELLKNIRHTFGYEKSIGFKLDREFVSHWYNIGLDLCSYKNPSFREEKEIRFAHLSGLSPQNEIVPFGAVDEAGKRLSEPIPIRFRIRDGAIVPYVVLDLTNGGKNQPVKEVVLGPKNENSELNVGLFLNTVGMKGVKIRRSHAPYR